MPNKNTEPTCEGVAQQVDMSGHAQTPLRRAQARRPANTSCATEALHSANTHLHVAHREPSLEQGDQHGQLFGGSHASRHLTTLSAITSYFKATRAKLNRAATTKLARKDSSHARQPWKVQHGCRPADPFPSPPVPSPHAVLGALRHRSGGALPLWTGLRQGRDLSSPRAQRGCRQPAARRSSRRPRSSRAGRTACSRLSTAPTQDGGPPGPTDKTISSDTCNVGGGEVRRTKNKHLIRTSESPTTVANFSLCLKFPPPPEVAPDAQRPPGVLACLSRQPSSQTSSVSTEDGGTASTTSLRLHSHSQAIIHILL